MRPRAEGWPLYLRTVLCVCALVLSACSGDGSSWMGAAPGSEAIPAQGECDEPLLDGDVVGARGADGGAVLVGADVELADGPLYESVESLAASADLIVRGTVGPVVSEAGSGPASAVRSVDVLEVLAGEAPPELLVDFVLGDTAGERCAPVVEGREVLLFLVTDGTDGVATHVVMGSFNNGVMTVHDGDALTHSYAPGRLRASDPPRDDLPADGSFPPPGLAFDLDDVRAVVADAARRVSS